MQIRYSPDLSAKIRRDKLRLKRKVRTRRTLLCLYIIFTTLFLMIFVFNKGQAQTQAQTKEVLTQTKLQTACQQHKGYPYVWGGESYREGGFDCSGFVYSVSKKIGKPLPRTTARKYWILLSNYNQKTWPNAVWGDLIWFTFKAHRPYGHIGIIIAQGRLWQSGSSTGPVEVGIWDGSYWDGISVGTKKWAQARR